MSPRRLAVGSAGGLLALVLGACSGDPELIVEPAPAPPSSSAAPTEPVVPTTTPAVAEQESAKEFIRRWQAASYAMQNSGDTRDYLAMTRSCSSCSALAEGVSEIYGGGGFVRDAGGKVSDIERVGKVDRVFIYEFRLRSRPSAVMDANGSVQTPLTGGESRLQVNLIRKSDSWLVTRISKLSA